MDREASRYTNSLAPGTGATFRDVPAGRWRLALNAGDQRVFPLEVWTRGSHQREIRIEDGRTTDVRIEVPRAGLVAFRLASDTPPDGGTWAGLTIRTEHDAPLEVQGYDRMRPRRVGSHIDRYGLRFVVKRAFPPGERAFVVEADGYLPARCKVQVELDRLVEVPVKLRRR